jgi:hypothetical protein
MLLHIMEYIEILEARPSYIGGPVSALPKSLFIISYF